MSSDFYEVIVDLPKAESIIFFKIYLRCMYYITITKNIHLKFTTQY